MCNPSKLGYPCKTEDWQHAVYTTVGMVTQWAWLCPEVTLPSTTWLLQYVNPHVGASNIKGPVSIQWLTTSIRRRWWNRCFMIRMHNVLCRVVPAVQGTGSYVDIARRRGCHIQPYRRVWLGSRWWWRRRRAWPILMSSRFDITVSRVMRRPRPMPMTVMTVVFPVVVSVPMSTTLWLQIQYHQSADLHLKSQHEPKLEHTWPTL